MPKAVGKNKHGGGRGCSYTQAPITGRSRPRDPGPLRQRTLLETMRFPGQTAAKQPTPDATFPCDDSNTRGGTPLASVTTPQLPFPPRIDAKEMKSKEIDSKDLELHEDEELHSFNYSIGHKGKKGTLNCVRRQTILEALMTCPTFKEKAIKNEGKELVIVRGKPGSFKAIAPHFPCCLIDKEEHLVIIYLKAKKNAQRINRVRVRPGTTRNDLVVFHVKKRDGILVSNTALTTKHAELLSVYAYKMETIQEALKRDGRCKSHVFSKLKDIKELDTTINISSHVIDDLNGKTFKVILDEKQPNGSVPSSSTNTSAPSTSSSTNTSAPSTSTSSPQQSAADVPVNTDRPEQTAKQKPRPIADSEKILALLRIQFPDLVERMKERMEDTEGKSKTTEELFRVEHGKSSKICKTVKIQRQLMDRANCVCQVRLNGNALGSGFLLFDNYVLTCAHVIYDDETKHLRLPLTVSFGFEDLDVQPYSVPVKPEPVVFEKLTDDSECFHDFALLELDSAPNLNGLLKDIATSPHKGGICIIGHPDGGVKVTDPCFIIPVDDRTKVVTDRYQDVRLQLITGQYFNFAPLVNQSPYLAYDSCFSEGSSGSPVFDELCNVVAMHTGGYAYKTQGRAQKEHPQSFIEYAQTLSGILPRIIIQIVYRMRFDVLEAYLHYTSIHNIDTCDKVKEDVKRIVERQNLNEFENHLKNYGGDSEKIMEFIKFFCPQDEPMEIASSGQGVVNTSDSCPW